MWVQIITSITFINMCLICDYRKNVFHGSDISVFSFKVCASHFVGLTHYQNDEYIPYIR